MRAQTPINEKYKGIKIIHVDMDCFYASVEIRDRPELKAKPVAVAGSSKDRGVVTTCNYIAREYGVRSAMPSLIAKKLCPDIIFLPVNMEKYRQVSKEIYKIYKCYTKVIEPVSLDEAYLDVTQSEYCNGDPEEMAKQIRHKICEDLGITASAGISSNKLLSKIASDWNKPNGQFSIPDDKINSFIRKIPIRKIHGVGDKTEKLLKTYKINTCEDLQKLSINKLSKILGKFGITLYSLCRGIDNREVDNNRISKSLSVEDTYNMDLINLEQCHVELKSLYNELLIRLSNEKYNSRSIKSCFVKIKFSDFRTISSQISSESIDFEIFLSLLKKNYSPDNKPIRLLGVGVQFNNKEQSQLNLDIS
tara:strand:- start:568 stop:1656 length:1089 start_codon:yes stop_codon:yes gene_type:complete